MDKAARRDQLAALRLSRCQAGRVRWRVPLEGSWKCTPTAPTQKRLWNFSPPPRPMHPNASDQRCFCRKVACNALVSQSNSDQLQERTGTMLTGARKGVAFVSCESPPRVAYF